MKRVFAALLSWFTGDHRASADCGVLYTNGSAQRASLEPGKWERISDWCFRKVKA